MSPKGAGGAGEGGLWDVLRPAIAGVGEAPLVEGPGGATLSGLELQRRARKVGGVLRDAGLGKGDRVAWLLEPGPEALVLYLGCLRAGCVAVPLNPALPEVELGLLLDDAAPKLVVCGSERRPRLEAAIAVAGVAPAVETLEPGGQGSFAEAMRRSAGAPAAACSPGDRAAFVYTSGTTGRSKGVVHTHRSLTANARALTAVWRFRRDDVLLHALPMFHVHGLFVACHCALSVGAGLLMVGGFDVDRVLSALPRATVMMGVPTFYHRLLEAGIDRARCAAMRLFLSGSAPLTASTAEGFQRRTGHRLYERYGMTETLITTAVPLDEHRPGTVGRALPGVELQVRSRRAGAPVAAPGEIGEVEVRGASLFEDYWRRPGQRDLCLREGGWFATGDLGRLDDEGFLRLEGRATEMIITGGENVHPLGVETAIADLDGVAEAAIFAVPDEDLGELVAAAVVLDGGRRELDLGELRASLRAVLAPHQIPRRLHVVEALPRNAMGKVRKGALRERFGPKR